MSMFGETQKYELYSNQLAFLQYEYTYVYTLRERERENPSSTLKPFTDKYVY